MGNPSKITIDGVLMVQGINHKLLSISQLYDKGVFNFFYTLSCLIEHKSSKILVVGWEYK